MIETERAYLAAAIDGEGCITFKTRRTSRTPWLYDVRVYITNTNLQWLQWIQSVLGVGRIHKNGRPSSVRCKVGYRYCVDAKIAIAVLREVRPYLRIKGPQADLAIAYSPVEQGTCGSGRGSMSDDAREQRTNAWFKMKALNKRGI